MESFIRSKYESRRWAPDEPPPSDPRVLENQGSRTASAAESKPQETPLLQSSSRSSMIFSDLSASQVSHQPRAHQLLSSPLTKKTPAASPVATTKSTPSVEPARTPQAPQITQNDLFSLDFHSPPPSDVPQQQPVKKDVKQDILSLFSNNTHPDLSINNYNTRQTSMQPQAQMFGWGQPSLSSS